MKIRLNILLLFLVLPFTAALAQDKADFERFQTQLRQKGAAISAIRCGFTQTRSMSILAAPVKKEGTFYYQDPDRILLSFQDGDYIKMTESAFMMENAGRVTKTKINVNPMLKNLKRILTACMTGDIRAAVQGFQLDLSETPAEYRLELRPQKGKQASRLQGIVLVFSKDSMSLNELKMMEPSGDYTAYRFRNKEFNVQLDGNLFNIN